jgi:hypothetical protein
MGGAAPDETLSGVISTGDGAALAVSTAAGLAFRPLLWLPDGGPAADDPGTLAAWTGGEPDRRLIAGPWLHQVDDDRPGWLTFRPDGTIPVPNVTWYLAGRTLTLTWPRPDAPAGAWVDRCLVSSDGTRYVGRNQAGNLIRGRTDEIAAPDQTFEDLAAIALCETAIRPADRACLRVRAIHRLNRFDPSRWRPVMEILLDDADPKIRELAAEMLR